MGFRIFYTITLQAGCNFSLSIQMYGLHSPSRCWLLFFKSYFMRVNIFHTLTLQPDFMFSLSMEMLGLHSPSRCWLFIILRFFHKVSYFILSLPKQVVGCHSPCRCLVYILQAHSRTSAISFFMGFDIFHTITLQAGCKFSLSKQMLAFSIFLIFDGVSHLLY